MTTDDDLGRAADELYGGAPGDFIAARKAAASAADGSELAGRISRLPKPAAAAAAVNALVHADAHALDALAAVGDRLRSAEADGDAQALRSLASERREAVAAATRATVERIEGAGSSVSASTRNAIEATYQAAVLDPRAATAVTSGVLVRTLAPGDEVADAAAVDVDPAGSGSGSGSDSAGRRSAARRGESAAEDDAAARRARAAAAAEAKAAEQEAAAAKRALDAADREADALEGDRDESQQRLDDLRRDVAELSARVAALDDDLAKAQRARRAAVSAERKARTRAAELRRRQQRP